MDAIQLIITTMQEHKYDAAVQSEGMRALLNLTTTVPENALKAASAGAIEATVRIAGMHLGLRYEQSDPRQEVSRLHIRRPKQCGRTTTMQSSKGMQAVPWLRSPCTARRVADCDAAVCVLFKEPVGHWRCTNGRVYLHTCAFVSPVYPPHLKSSYLFYYLFSVQEDRQKAKSLDAPSLLKAAMQNFPEPSLGVADWAKTALQRIN